MASAKKDKNLPPGWDFRPTGNTTPTTTPGGVKPGDSVLYPATSKKGLAPGKFYVDSKTGNVYKVARPGFKDILFLGSDDAKSGSSKSTPQGGSLPPGWDFRPPSNTSKNDKSNAATSTTSTTVQPGTGASAQEGKIVSQKEYDAAKKTAASTAAELAEAMAALSQIGEDKVYKGVTYSGAEGDKKLRAIIEKLKVPAETAAKNLKIIEAPIKEIQYQIKEIDKKLKPVSDFDKRGGKKDISGAEKKRLTAEKKALEEKLTVAPTTTTTAPPTTTTTTPAATTSTTPGVTTTTTPGATATTAPASTPTTTPAATTTTVPGKTTTTTSKTPLMDNLQNPSSRNKVGATPSGASGGGGGTGGGGGGSTTTGSGKNNKKNTKDKLAPAVDYEALKVQFPQYAWILDLDPQYDDLKKITVDVINGPENGGITQERWNQLAPGTSWFMDKATIAASRRVRNRFGDIPFANGGFSKIVSDTMNQKYDDATLDTAFYGEAFRRDPITGNYVNDAAAKTVLKSTNANKYRTYAKNMFSSVSDDTIVSLLTGEKTVEDFDRSLRTVAKNVYGNLAQQLDDPSMDMATIVRPWQEHAAKVLEMDPSQIDMTLPQFQIAYSGNTENGQTKALSIGEWNQKLRTDSIYNWKNTNTAKQGARELAFNLASAFGKII